MKIAMWRTTGNSRLVIAGVENKTRLYIVLYRSCDFAQTRARYGCLWVSEVARFDTLNALANESPKTPNSQVTIPTMCRLTQRTYTIQVPRNTTLTRLAARSRSNAFQKAR